MRRIRCAVLAAVGVVGLGSVSSAAQPMTAPAYSWTGFYAGGNIGYSWGTADSNYNESHFSPIGLSSISQSENLDGLIGGGQIGYNWQPNNMSVVGLEADFQGSGEKGTSTIINPYTIGAGIFAIDPAITVTNSTDLQWFGTVRGRIGPLLNPTTWLYATAGFAYGGINASGTVTSAVGTWSFSDTTIGLGWTLGAGVEGAIANTRNWTWKLEYLYIDLGTFGGNGLSINGFPYGFSTKVTDNILRVGINYNFH